MARMIQTHDGWVLRNDWTTDDVEARLEDYWGFELTQDECLNVLNLVADAFDANYGITWDSIDSAIESLYGHRRVEE